MAYKKKLTKKKFFKVEIPFLKREVELYSTDTQTLNEKTISMDLAPELRGKGATLKLLIKADAEKATASPVELKLLVSYLRRMVRKGTDYCEDSFITKCKDHEIRIKPFLITRNRVTRKVLARLRENTKQEIEDYVKDKTFEAIISELLDSGFQKYLGTKLKKVYPLSLSEIKYIAIYDKKEYVEEAEQKKPAKEEVETPKPEETEEIKPASADVPSAPTGAPSEEGEEGEEGKKEAEEKK